MSASWSAPSPSAHAEFVRGWPVLLLAVLGVATSVSGLLIYSFGTMVVPLQQAMGWSRADLQLTVSFLSAGGALSVNFAGWLNLRYGMRRVSAVSLVALALGMLAVTRIADSIAWLYLAYFLLPFIGLGTTPVTWTQLVNLWFVRRRGLALSLALCGTGLSAAVLPPLMSWAMARSDWRAGYGVMAMLPLVVTLPLAWRLLPSRRDPAAAPGPSTHPAPDTRLQAGMSLEAALRSRNFWICNLALSMVVSAVVGMVTNAVPILRDIGLSATAASGVFSVFGFSLVAGRLVVGTLIDRYWAPGVAAVALGMPAIGCVMLMLAQADTPIAWLLVAVALVGVGSGAEFDIAAFLMARYFGLRDYGKLFGLHLGLVTAGSATAPFVFAALLRSSGSYHPMLSLCMACCVIGPLLLLALGPYPRDENVPLGTATP
jgi:MFS family permease